MNNSAAQILETAKESIRNRVDRGYSVGIVLGLITDTGTEYFSYGSSAMKEGQKVNENSVFEIGSITKPFTTALLAQMVNSNEVSLDDPVQKFLPDKVKIPSRGDQEITLVDLATHTSALPRNVGNVGLKSVEYPYSIDYMYEYLSSCQLQHDIGSKPEYSNLGYGLLGHALSLKAGGSYGEIIKKRILMPLDMADTGVKMDPDLTSRVVKGHTRGRESAYAPTSESDAGAGDLRSTAKDLLKFLAANMGLIENPLVEAMQSTHIVRQNWLVPNTEIGLGWLIRQQDSQKIVNHGGTTYGYMTFAGFIREKKLGVVVLSNSNLDIQDLGFHILNSALPLRKTRTPVSLAPDKLSRFTGRFEIEPGILAEFNVREQELTLTVPEQGDYVLPALSDSVFFSRESDATVEFKEDGEGNITHIIWNQGSYKINAPKVDKNYKPPARKEVSVSPDILETYVGEYEMSPSYKIKIFMKDKTLYGQATNEPSGPLYPESETKVFSKLINIQLSFVKDATGKVTHMILHRAGQGRYLTKI